MIETTTAFWFMVGLLAGLAHAALLWHASGALTASTPIWGMLRLAVVASVLTLSAVSGAILVATAGWAVGMSWLGTWYLFRLRERFAHLIKRTSQRVNRR